MHLRSTALRAATLLRRNPRLFCRVMTAKLNTPRRVPPFPTVRRINSVLFEVGAPGSGAAQSMCFGSYAPLVVDAMKRWLRPGDVFFDVGANTGYLSAIAAGLVGTRGQVHAFEPVPQYFYQLKRLAELNPSHAILANPCAAGEADATRTIYLTRKAGQNTLIRTYKNASEITGTHETQVVRLDSYIENKGIDQVTLIKIDVEGYEFHVLKGLERYLHRASSRPPIICEIAPRAYPLIGSSLSDMAEYMKGFGYSAFDIADGTSATDIRTLKHVDDVLFLPRTA